MFLTALDFSEPEPSGPTLGELHDAYLAKQAAAEAGQRHVRVGPARWEPEGTSTAATREPRSLAKGARSSPAAAARLALLVEMAASSDRQIADIQGAELVRQVGKSAAAQLTKAVETGMRPGDAVAAYLAGRASRAAADRPGVTTYRPAPGEDIGFLLKAARALDVGPAAAAVVRPSKVQRRAIKAAQKRVLAEEFRSLRRSLRGPSDRQVMKARKQILKTLQ